MSIETDVNGLVELVSNFTDAYTTAVFLADNQRRILRLWHFYSLGDNVNPKAKISYGVGPIGTVAESKQEFDLTKFAERDSSLLEIYSRNESIKSFFAVPIINKDGILEGVISIDSKRNFVFSNKEQKLLKLFAKQFSDLINNLKIKNFIDTETSDIDFLYNFCKKITTIDDVDSILQITLDSIKKLVECDSYFISLKTNEEDDEFRIVASDCRKDLKGSTYSDQYGLAGRVVEEKRPFLLGNRRGDFGSYVFTASESLGRVRSFLGIPLISYEDVIGLICLVDDDEEMFNYRDQQVLSIMADGISLAISNIKAQTTINRLSTDIDGLTGLRNFTGFNKYIEILIQAVKRKRRPLSLMMVDIDKFAEINDTCGYETGNEILRQMAQFLLDTDQKSNISVARFGSDEFSVTLPNIKMDHAFTVAEEVCLAVEKPMFILPERSMEISVSIGVSCFPDNSTDKHELISNSLHALSIAKSKGGGIAWAMDAK